MPAVTLPPAQARELREQHDAYVRGLWRKPRGTLAALCRREMAARGRQMLYGGPASKDELTSALAGLRFPLARLNEAIHVLHHDQESSSSACRWCHPHQGGPCDCGLASEGEVTESWLMRPGNAN